MVERILNGGWEDQWDNWVHSNFTMSSADPHGGIYHLWGYSLAAYVEQTLVSPVAVDEVLSFVIWAKCGGYSGAKPTFTLEVYYDDATNSSDNIEMGQAWTEYDLSGYLTAGKTIEKIKLIYHNSNWWGQFDDWSLDSVATGGVGDVDIQNLGGKLSCCVIRLREVQACKVPVRDTPIRTTGSFVDTGTWTLKNRRLYMTLRLTDAMKTLLKAIFDYKGIVTITAVDSGVGTWIYTGWFVTKPIVYEYSVDSNGDVNEWAADITFVLSSFSYA